MKTFLLAVAASLILSPSVSAQTQSVVDQSAWPLVTCSGAHPFNWAYTVEPTSITRLREGSYSAVFVIRLSVHWAPPAPQTLGIAANDGGACDITLPPNMRVTFISEAPPSAASPCENLGGWIRPTANPSLDTAIKHGATIARLRWDADPDHWNSDEQRCSGGQVNYSVAVAYKAR